MGYIFAVVLIAVVVPLLFLFLGRRTTGAGGMGRERHAGGMTPSEPSSDQPTPEADAVNQVAPGAEKRLPPG